MNGAWSSVTQARSGPHPWGRPFAACRGDRRAGAQVVEHVAQRVGGLHEVVYRAEQGGVGHTVDGRGGDRGGDQGDVVPACSVMRSAAT
jgi:hypothetical protein